MKDSMLLCPQCGSINVKKDLKLTLLIGIPQKWKCRDCEFAGHLFPEVPNKNIELVQKEIKKFNEDNNNAK
jgi:rubredoxin